jgi:hypothetical protein
MQKMLKPLEFVGQPSYKDSIRVHRADASPHSQSPYPWLSNPLLLDINSVPVPRFSMRDCILAISYLERTANRIPQRLTEFPEIPFLARPVNISLVLDASHRWRSGILKRISTLIRRTTTMPLAQSPLSRRKSWARAPPLFIRRRIPA